VRLRELPLHVRDAPGWNAAIEIDHVDLLL